MKYLISIILLLNYLQSYTQNNFPSYSQNPLWEMTFETDIQIENFSFRLASDTSICGYNWIPILQYDETGINSETIGYFRESGSQVFVRKTIDCSDNEYLMYDFDAQQGDTLWCGFNLNTTITDSIPIEILANESQVYNGIERTVIYAKYQPDPFSIPILFEWVEGVGDLTHPFYSLNCYSYFCGELNYYFHCLYTNNNLVFTNPASFQTPWPPPRTTTRSRPASKWDRQPLSSGGR